MALTSLERNFSHLARSWCQSSTKIEQLTQHDKKCSRRQPLRSSLHNHNCVNFPIRVKYYRAGRPISHVILFSFISDFLISNEITWVTWVTHGCSRIPGYQPNSLWNTYFKKGFIRPTGRPARSVIDSGSLLFFLHNELLQILKFGSS